jgi:hypothetical protein
MPRAGHVPKKLWREKAEQNYCKEMGCEQPRNCGAMLGVLVVVAHEAYDICLGYVHNVDPMVHIISEFSAAGLLGAVLFVVVSRVRNWIAEKA